MSRHKKNINQTDLFDLVEQLEQLEQLEQVNSELNMTFALGHLELSTIVEKQVDWVEL
jgi:hypothetical protein